MAANVRIGEVVLGDRPRIVAAGGEAELPALVAAEGADLVELRADLFDAPTPEGVVAALGRLRGGGRPVILTVRAEAEGGRPMDEARRRAIYLAGLPAADAVDVEIAAAALVAEVVPAAHAAGKTVLLSAHALDATPPNDALLSLVDRAEAAGADVTKLAAHARDREDVRRLLEVTLAARRRNVVVIAMGAAGTLSRVLFPAAGSLLTYASVGRPTAPGQIPAAELAALLRRLYG
ncbi:MAG TPA: type I 3-dehydroquinate dehydratase [Candidatus Binatia bacterium]|nr:type I 3-dehydroquinate dehydratase [Candidatus Binatia bacterium]